MCCISIIIPVYNSEKYLAKCLDSVLNQTFSDIEVICVNDGSTDASGKTLCEYAGKDSRVKIVEKENGGASSARKAGLVQAHGEYIGYVDSDDWIESDMYEKLYSYAQKYSVDMVSCGYYLEGSYTTRHIDTVEQGLYDGEKIKYLRDNTIYRLDKKETGLRASLCCKLFRRELFTDVQLNIPDNIVISEDKMCLIHYILHCQSVYVVREPFYHWCIHQESMSHKGNADYLLWVNEVYKYFISLYEHENFTGAMRKQAEIYVTELLIQGINTRMGFRNSNMLWIDSYWVSKIPGGARVVVYGGGALGEKYLKQLRHRKDVSCVAELGFHVPDAQWLKDTIFDVIVIAIKNAGKAQSVREQFIELGVDSDKILWFEQPEVFWKYAEAEGLLEE
jgi:glycosyltransferase involved in cell wall biosynthesis